MKTVAVTLVTVVLIAAQLRSGLTSPSTVPAFLWSNFRDGYPNNRMKKEVFYQTFSSRDLAKSVMSEGGWSNLLCSGREQQQLVDVVLFLVGRELRTPDISAHKYADPMLMDLLQVAFRKSNFSVAFPYIATSGEKEAVESSLVSEFAETCGHDMGVSNFAIMESCSVKGDNFGKLADIHSVHDFLVSRMQTRSKGQTDFIALCHGGSSFLEGASQSRSEGQIFSEIINLVEQSGVKYTVLYVSDPFMSIQYPSHRELERFLAEGASGNKPLKSTSCDGICQIKSSLLEGLLVAIVLLIILISGLCCMMGIDTPTRFETPQES